MNLLGPSLAATLALGATASPAGAQSSPSLDQPAMQAELDRLRQELDDVRGEYTARLAELEWKLSQLEHGVPAPPGVAPREDAGLPSGTGVSPTSEGPPQAAAAGAADAEGRGLFAGAQPASSSVFNPDMAVIGDFLGAAGRNGTGARAFQMHESEASFQAVVDPYSRADFFVSFGEQGVDLEEGTVTFPAIRGGLLVKVGKMRAAFGKVNGLHNHVLPWSDRPILTDHLLGGEDGINDAGVSVARLVPNPWLFLEATGQVFRGDSGDDLYRSSRSGDVSYVGHVRGYHDLSESTNVDVGASFSTGHNAAGVVGDSDVGRFRTRLHGVDATVRWRPLRRSIYHSFIGRTEAVWSHREQFGGSQDATGFYASGDYQVARRWFAGLRFDRSGRADDASLVDRGQSVVLTYWPSEFSQVRAQYRRTARSLGPTAHELLFQVQFSIGAHGAHPF